MLSVGALGVALAGGLPPTQPPSPAASPAEHAEASAPPFLATLGVTAGFPSYQTVAAAFSVQAQYLGFQVKASYTPVGPYLGAELRGYPPVPFPVPMFVGVGGGVYGGNGTFFATVGANVPLDLHWRLDVEAGAANVPLLAGRTWAPFLSLGVSYAFAFEPTRGGVAPAEAGPASAPAAGASCVATAAPDASSLLGAFRGTLHDWIASARATYGSIYADLRYSYSVTSTSVHGDTGTVTIHYSGSVVTIATGQRVSASGDASASYRWNGCGWSNVGVQY